MAVEKKNRIFWIALACFIVTFVWLVASFFNIEGMDIKVDMSLSTMKAAVQSTEIDVPITARNVRNVVWHIGVPLYLNLVSVCFLINFLGRRERKQ